MALVESSQTGLAAKMYAAKPITWRGRGDLAQVPWSQPCRGAWLVLDCWSGMGGLCIALLQLGWHFYAVAAEPDPIAQAAVHNMPNLVHVPRIEDLHAKDFLLFLQRRNIRGILMGGGSPCQGNSSLNLRRKSLEDPRSQQPLELKRLRAEFADLPECASLELVVFLENVASMTKEVRDHYSQWMDSSPVCVDAAACGWVQRRSLFWLVGRKGPLHAGITRLLLGPGRLRRPTKCPLWFMKALSRAHHEFSFSRTSSRCLTRRTWWPSMEWKLSTPLPGNFGTRLTALPKCQRLQQLGLRRTAEGPRRPMRSGPYSGRDGNGGSPCAKSVPRCMVCLRLVWVQSQGIQTSSANARIHA